MDFALANYPAVRASMERALASKEGVSLSRTTYLPRTDLLWQSNRATRNNIFGLLLPQSVVPPISGPVLLEYFGPWCLGECSRNTALLGTI